EMPQDPNFVRESGWRIRAVIGLEHPAVEAEVHGRAQGVFDLQHGGRAGSRIPLSHLTVAHPSPFGKPRSLDGRFRCRVVPAETETENHGLRGWRGYRWMKARLWNSFLLIREILEIRGST